MRLLMTNMMSMAIAILLLAASAEIASATELWSGGTTLAAGTKVTSSLATGTSAVLTDTSGNPIDTCNESTVSYVTQQSKAEVISGSATMTYGGCTQTTTMINSGKFTGKWIPFTNSATVFWDEKVTTVNVFGVSCAYGTSSAGRHVGTQTGAYIGRARTHWNGITEEIAPKQFLCPDTAKMVAEYVVTSPEPLHFTE